MKTITKIIFIMIGLLLLVGCTSNEPNLTLQTPANQDDFFQNNETGYPLSEPQGREDGYPVIESEPFYEPGPEFNIQQPVSGGETIVTGTGPAGVPIRLVSVSDLGLVLAETVIMDDGTFTFVLQDPLKSGYSIGLQLGDIKGTGLSEGDFIYSDTYFERPLVGILFDLVVVE
jgi:hypothetical protein